MNSTDLSVLKSAVEWLMEHQDDVDIDEPIPAGAGTAQSYRCNECGRILSGRLGRSFFSATTMMAVLSFRISLQIVLVLSRLFGGSEFRATPMHVWFARRSVRRRRWHCSASRQQARHRSPLARKFLHCSRLLPMVFRNSTRVRSGQAGTDSRPVAELFAAYSSVLVLRSWPLLCSQ